MAAPSAAGYFLAAAVSLLTRRPERGRLLFGCCCITVDKASELLRIFWLLNVHAFPSIRDGNGRTALHFAATGGSASVVGAILDMAPRVIDSKVPLLIFLFVLCSRGNARFSEIKYHSTGFEIEARTRAEGGVACQDGVSGERGPAYSRA